MTRRGRFTCLLAILTVLGGTIFGVTGALGQGDAGHRIVAVASAGQSTAGHPAAAHDVIPTATSNGPSSVPDHQTADGSGAPAVTGGPATTGGPGDGHTSGAPTTRGPGDGHTSGPPTTRGPGDVNAGGPPTTRGPGDVNAGGPPTTGGPGDVNAGGPPTTGGPGDVNAGGPPTTGGPGDRRTGGPPTGDGPRTIGKPGDGHGGDGHRGGDSGGGPQIGRPSLVPSPPPTNGGIGNPGNSGGGGNDHGQHHSGRALCSGVCHSGNDQQPTPSIPLTTTGPTVTQAGSPQTGGTPTPPSPPATHVSPTPGFSLGSPSLVTQPRASNNPSADVTSLGSAASTGANGQASAGGLGLLAPATSDVGLQGGSGSTPGTGAGGGHAGTGGSSSSDGGRRGSQPLDLTSVGPAAVLEIVNVVPTVVWIALGASLLLSAAFGGVAVLNGRRARRNEGQLQRVSAVALTDPLTGVLNRRGFTEAIERELARARRHDRPFVLAYVDVRGLKAVNDTEGHLAGDELLKAVATLLTESARADDVVGRIGGDELGVLLVEQSGDSAAAVTDRIEAQVDARRSALGLRAPWGLTVGTAAFPGDGGTFDELLAAADRRLYEQRGIALAQSRG